MKLAAQYSNFTRTHVPCARMTRVQSPCFVRRIPCYILAPLKISSDAGPPLSSRPMPARPVSVPDATASVTVSREQALLYRLSGDYNAIHADLEAARSAGLDGPILHGLCSLGVKLKHDGVVGG